MVLRSGATGSGGALIAAISNDTKQGLHAHTWAAIAIQIKVVAYSSLQNNLW